MKDYLLIVYVPSSSSEQLKGALFAAGAGRVGNYDCCCWQVEGQGQFRPRPGAQPHIGRIDEIEQLSEMRLEMMVKNDARPAVDRALNQNHPYETPAYFWVELGVQPNG